MRRITATIVTTITLIIGIGTAHAAQAPKPTHSPTVTRSEVIPKERQPNIKFQHGDISWLPQLAAEAGWPPAQFKKLGQIILRESGGCPNRRGGDIVDKACNVTGVTDYTHRSDSGLLQLNGVHWKPDHKYYAGLICKQMKICTQEPLLDALTNLKAGLLLFRATGSDWSPWIVPEGGW